MKLSWSQKLFLKINRTLGTRPWLDRMMYFFGFWVPWILAFSYGFFVLQSFFLGPQHFWFFVFFSSACFVFAYLVSYTIALVFQHERPIKELPNVRELFVTLGTWKSFPSDHTIAVTLFAVLAFFVTDNGWVLALFSIFGSIAAFGRIYSGVHYPRDILGGIGVGVFSFYAILLLTRLW